MGTAYSTETHEECYRDRTILVENVTPILHWEEREAVKRDIEDRLYDVFSTYASN